MMYPAPTSPRHVKRNIPIIKAHMYMYMYVHVYAKHIIHN